MGIQRNGFLPPENVSALVPVNHCYVTGNTEFSRVLGDVCPRGSRCTAPVDCFHAEIWANTVRAADVSEKPEIGGFLLDFSHFKIDTKITKILRGCSQACLPGECGPAVWLLCPPGLPSLRDSITFISWDRVSRTQLESEGLHCRNLYSGLSGQWDRPDTGLRTRNGVLFWAWGGGSVQTKWNRAGRGGEMFQRENHSGHVRSL